MGKISSSLLGLAVLLFLLPWVTVSCGGAKVFTFSGTDFAIGKTIEIPQAFGESKEENTRDGRATIAFIVGIAGVLVGFLIKKEQVQKVVLSTCGGAGGILLYLFKIKLDGEALAEEEGVIGIDYHFSFYVSMLLFFTTCMVNILSVTGLLKKISLKPIQSILKSSPRIGFCSQCGAKVSPDDTFCSECGHSTGGIGKGTKAVSSKWKELIETTKLKGEIKDVQNSMQNKFQALGKKVFEMLNRGVLNEEELRVNWREIASLFKKLTDVGECYQRGGA